MHRKANANIDESNAALPFIRFALNGVIDTYKVVCWQANRHPTVLINR